MGNLDVDRVYDSIRKMEISLESQTHANYHYYQDMLTKCDLYVNVLAKYYSYAKQEHAKLEVSKSMLSQEIEIKRRNHIKNNEEIQKKYSTGRERELAIDGLLEDDISELNKKDNRITILKNLINVLSTWLGIMRDRKKDAKEQWKIICDQSKAANLPDPDDKGVANLNKIIGEIERDASKTGIGDNIDFEGDEVESGEEYIDSDGDSDESAPEASDKDTTGQAVDGDSLDLDLGDIDVDEDLISNSGGEKKGTEEESAEATVDSDDQIDVSDSVSEDTVDAAESTEIADTKESEDAVESEDSGIEDDITGDEIPYEDDSDGIEEEEEDDILDMLSEDEGDEKSEATESSKEDKKPDKKEAPSDQEDGLQSDVKILKNGTEEENSDSSDLGETLLEGLDEVDTEELDNIEKEISKKSEKSTKKGKKTKKSTEASGQTGLEKDIGGSSERGNSKSKKSVVKEDEASIAEGIDIDDLLNSIE